MATDHQQSPKPSTQPPHPNMTEEHHIKSPPQHRKGRFSRYYGGGYRLKTRREAIFMSIFILLLLAAITALIVWLLYRPNGPKFKVVSASVYQLNATTAPPQLAATMQFTVIIRNPNRRVLIVYEDLSALVLYRNQPITAPLVLPPLFHETKSTVAMSPVLGGGAPVPAEGEVVNGLLMDQEAYGVVGLSLVVTGDLRYRGGPVGGRRHRVYVRCDLYVGLRKGFVGQLPLLGSPPCAVNVY